MSSKVFFGKNDVRFFYYRYKDSNYYSLSITAVIIVVCVLLVFYVIVPQVQSYFSISNQVAVQRQKLDTLRENINFVNNLDKSLLESQFQSSVQALPIEKDFIAILNAISDAGVLSGVSVSDFSFNAGREDAASDILSVDIAIQIDGSIDKIKAFVREINEKLPIAEVKLVSATTESTTVNLKFYYKTYKKVEFSDDKSLTAISDGDKELLRKLTSWKSPNFILPEDLSEEKTGSSSSLPLFE